MAAACGGEGLFFGLCSQLSARFNIVSLRLEKLVEKEIGELRLFAFFTAIKKT